MEPLPENARMPSPLGMLSGPSSPLPPPKKRPKFASNFLSTEELVAAWNKWCTTTSPDPLQILTYATQFVETTPEFSQRPVIDYRYFDASASSGEEEEEELETNHGRKMRPAQRKAMQQQQQRQRRPRSNDEEDGDYLDERAAGASSSSGAKVEDEETLLRIVELDPNTPPGGVRKVVMPTSEGKTQREYHHLLREAVRNNIRLNIELVRTFYREQHEAALHSGPALECVRSCNHYWRATAAQQERYQLTGVHGLRKAEQSFALSYHSVVVSQSLLNFGLAKSSPGASKDLRHLPGFVSSEFEDPRHVSALNQRLIKLFM